MSSYARAAKGERERAADDDRAGPMFRVCCAFGCPEAGSIGRSPSGPPDGDWLCRWHFGEPPERWPEITRARRIAEEAAGPPPAPVDRVRRLPGGEVDVAYYRKRLAGLSSIMEKQPSKDWARRLKQKEQDGCALTEAQRQAWRAALKEPAGAIEDGGHDG